METTTLRDRVKEMSEDELRVALGAIATSLDLGEIPNMFELYHIFW